MADIIFKIVAVVTTLGGFATAVLMFLSILIGAGTNFAEAERTLPWVLVPAAVAAFGVWLCFKAF